MRFSRNRRVPGIRHPPYFIPKLAAPNSPAICGLKLDGTRPCVTPRIVPGSSLVRTRS